jgi:hypothetical protein
VFFRYRLFVITTKEGAQAEGGRMEDAMNANSRRMVPRAVVAASVLVALMMAPRVHAQERAQDTARSGDGWVVLPVDDYRALRAKAFPPDRPPDPPPVDAVISGVDYELTVNGESASGQARLTIDVFKEGWVRVPMPPGLLVRDARIDGRQVALVEDGGPGSKSGKASSSSLLLSKTGRSLLTLDIVISVTARAGTEQVALPASAAALTRATVAVPRADVDVTAAGGLVTDRATTAQTTRVTANGGAGQPLVLMWARARQNHRAAEPLRLRAGMTEMVGLGEDSGHLTLRTDIEVVQGLASTVTLTLPAGVVVNDVSGALMSDWEVKGDALSVTFLEPVADRATLAITGEFRPPREGRVEVPIVRLAQAERETGGVAVEVLGAGELTQHDARGLDPTEPADLGDIVAGRDSPALVAFRYALHDPSAARSLAVTVSRYTPQAVLLANVDEARYRVLMTEDGKTLVDGRLAVRNNQRNFLGVTLPAGATLWTAAIDGRAVRPGKSSNGLLLLPLRKGRVGADAPVSIVTIAYFDRHAIWSGSGQVDLKLPAIDLPVSRTGVVVHHSPRFHTTLEPGAFRVDTYERPVTNALLMNEETGRLQSGAGIGGGVGSGTGGFVDDFNKSKPKGADAEAKTTFGSGVTAERLRQAQDAIDADEQRMLVNRYMQEHRGARALGVQPVAIQFPQIGPMLYLATELTAEGNAPTISLRYKREGD